MKERQKGIHRNNYLNLLTVLTAIFAANSTGKLYTPVDMEGNAIDLIPLSIASYIELK